MTTQGVVKTYDPATGIGVVVLDEDGSEVYLRPGSLKGSIFRFVRQGQRLIVDLAEEGDARYVEKVSVGQDGR